jgi:hypothetical protein
MIECVAACFKRRADAAPVAQASEARVNRWLSVWVILTRRIVAIIVPSEDSARNPRTSNGGARMDKAIALAAGLGALFLTADAQAEDYAYGRPETGVTVIKPDGTYTAIPTVYGRPEFGTTIIAPKGTYTMTPTVYGRPEFGTTTTAPDGMSCTTSPKLYGHPEMGMATTCR